MRTITEAETQVMTIMKWKLKPKW